MKRIYVFLSTFFALVILGFNSNAQVLLTESFDYPVGDSITSHGWIGHSGFGTNTLSVIAGSISYTGFPNSIGNSVSMKNNGHDAHKDFAVHTAGSIYASILIKVDSSKTTGDYFMHFMKPNNSTVLVGRVFIKRDATLANKFAFGISKNSAVGSAVLTPYSYDVNTEYLVVLKYNIKTGIANDSVSLFINPAISAEGLPTLVATDMSSAEVDTISAISLRQGNASNAATLKVDEIRVANNWNDAIGYTAVVTTPVVTTETTTNIAQTSANCGGNVSSNGGSVIIERGICYGISSNPDTSGTKIIVTGNTGIFSANLSNLTSATLYHYRAYAINIAGISYGADSTFTTSATAVAPIVTTGSVTSILATTATVSGEVSNDGGSLITERGICWSTAVNPTISDSKVIVNGTTGIFNGNLTLLTGSTLYHVRAYATNSVGTSYGADVTFTTAVDTIICTSIADLRSKPANNTTVYKLANEVILTCKITNRNQKYIQDTSAAILIDDPNPAKITTVYNIGDGITGIRGKLENYFGLLEFHPITDPGVATSTSNVVNPLIVTASNIQDTTFMKNHQAKLIKIENVSFTDANGVNKFANGKKYRMTQNTITDSLFYTYIYSIDYINTFLPSGLGNVTGVVNFTKNLYYITARNAADLSFIALPDTAGVIVGPSTVCQGQTNVTYSVPAIANATSYAWTLPAGFIGTSNGNSITLSVSNNAVSGNISVNGVNTNGNGVASTLPIIVNPLPAAAGVITGYQNVCEGNLNQLYFIQTVQNAVNYQWYYQGNGVMINGNDTSAIVNFNLASTSGFLVVKPVNACGMGDSSKLAITVNPIPVTPVITKNGNTLTSNASSGNQWFNTTTGIINNATATTYLPQQNGYYYVIVTLNGCSSDSSNIIHYDNTGINNIGNNETGIYPNPTYGKFTLNIDNANGGDVKIYSMVGSLILSKEVNKGINDFDLSSYGKGVYFIKFTDKNGKTSTEKLIVR